MDLNRIVFPSPKLSWDYREFLGELIFIPAKRTAVDQNAFNRRVLERSQKGTFPGSLVNPLENELAKNREIVMDHYHYTKSGADFTMDMHEKHPMNELPVQAPPVLRAHYNASKDLDMTTGSPKNLPKQPSFTNDAIDCTSDPRKDNHPVDSIREKDKDDLLDTDESNSGTGSGAGIHKIRASCNKPIFQEIDCKNPREFDDFVNNLVDRYIPGILIAPSNQCAKLLIFYHANAEDIGQAYSFCKEVNEKLEVGPSYTRHTCCWWSTPATASILGKAQKKTS